VAVARSWKLTELDVRVDVAPPKIDAIVAVLLTVKFVVAVLFTRTITVIVTTSFGFNSPIFTVTVRLEEFAVAVPFVVVTLMISTYVENWSVTVAPVTSAVPVLLTTIVYVAF
jgi:hypothetical protein